jgi:hypothetical protein
VSPFPLLGGAGLVGRLAPGRRGVGRRCATLSVARGFGLGGRCWLRRGEGGESLHPLPDAGDGGVAIWNFRMGWTSGRLLQMASRRLAGQDRATSVNARRLPKVSTE